MCVLRIFPPLLLIFRLLEELWEFPVVFLYLWFIGTPAIGVCEVFSSCEIYEAMVYTHNLIYSYQALFVLILSCTADSTTPVK